MIKVVPLSPHIQEQVASLCLAYHMGTAVYNVIDNPHQPETALHYAFELGKKSKAAADDVRKVQP